MLLSGVPREFHCCDGSVPRSLWQLLHPRALRTTETEMRAISKPACCWVNDAKELFTPKHMCIYTIPQCLARVNPLIYKTQRLLLPPGSWLFQSIPRSLQSIATGPKESPVLSAGEPLTSSRHRSGVSTRLMGYWYVTQWGTTTPRCTWSHSHRSLWHSPSPHTHFFQIQNFDIPKIVSSSIVGWKKCRHREWVK